MTANRFFNPEQLEILLNPSDWEIAAPFLPIEVSASQSQRSQEWYHNHKESHNVPELMIALAGKVPYGFMTKAYTCRPGTILYFDAHIDHQLMYPPFAQDLEHLWFNILQDHFTARLIKVKKGTFSTQWTISSQYSMQFPPIDTAYLNGEGLPAARRAYFSSWVGMLIAALLKRSYEPLESDDKGSFQDDIISAVQKHIKDTGGKNASLDHLARISGYSKYHFHRLFKKCTGYRIQEYVDMCRKEYVAQQIDKGVALNQIGADLGFASPASFSRWMKNNL